MEGAAPSRAVLAEGPAVAPKGRPGGARGIQKRGLGKALKAAAAAHPRKRLELWFQDEARVGNKGRICHRWWIRGQRAPGRCDQRYEWAYIFSAVRPATGEDFTLVLPEVSARAMDLFLAKFAQTLAADTHAVLVLDGAGWHATAALDLPDNITLVPLPPYSPELNPVERIWLYLRERYLSLRMLDDYDAILEACCRAWNDLTETKDVIRSLTSYPWISEVDS